MRVVELDGSLFDERVERTVFLLVTADDVLERAGNEEDLLDEAELAADGGLVVRVEHLRDGFAVGFFADSFDVAAFVELVEVEFAGCLSFPEAEEVNRLRLVTDDRNIPRNTDDRRRVHPARLEVAVFVVREFDMAVKRNFDAAGCALDVPRVAGEKPVVGVFNLIAVRERLAEETEFVVNPVTDCREVERSEGVQEAGSETAETAVTEAHILFFFENGFRIDAEFLQSGLSRFEQTCAGKIVAEQAAHQVFDGKVVTTTRLFVDVHRLRIDEAVVNQVADGAARREKPVMRRRRVFVAGERATQVVEDPLLERIDFRLGRRRDNFRLGGSFDGFNFYLGDRFFCFRCFCHYVFCFLCKN